MLLNERERAQAVADVARLIQGSGQRAVVQRMVPGEQLYSSDDSTYSDIGEIPLELDETPPEELTGKIDAIADVLPDADVIGEDRLVTGSGTYKIQSVEPANFFGAVTHKILQLVKLHGR
jgi:hypothetical protein